MKKPMKKDERSNFLAVTPVLNVSEIITVKQRKKKGKKVKLVNEILFSHHINTSG